VTVRVLQPIPVRDAGGAPLAIDELKASVREAFLAAGLRAGDADYA
jgi:hypothetical protein